MESSGAEEGRTNVSLLPLTKETLSDTFISNIKNIKNRTGQTLDMGSRGVWRCVGEVWKRTSNHWQFQVVGNNFYCDSKSVNFALGDNMILFYP